MMKLKQYQYVSGKDRGKTDLRNSAEEKKYDGKLWLRNIVSDLTSLFIDSIIFIPLAFYGILPDGLLPIIMFGQVATKWIFGTLDTPFIYLNRWILRTDNALITKWAGVGEVHQITNNN